MNKVYLENNVYKFRISFDKSLETSVYVKSFPDLTGSNLTFEQRENEYRRREQLVKEKYFTKEKIDEYKKEFIKMIEETENPFDIYCYDEDAGYKITENELTNLD